MKNINALYLTIGVAAALAIALAPSLAPDASAVKEEQEEECTQDTGGADLGERCPGQSGGQNPNREQQECDVTAGSNDQRVSGQYKKLCE
jgi:hypothetical protein